MIIIAANVILLLGVLVVVYKFIYLAGIISLISYDKNEGMFTFKALIYFDCPCFIDDDKPMIWPVCHHVMPRRGRFITCKSSISCLGNVDGVMAEKKETIRYRYDGDGKLVPSMGNKYMEVEECGDDVEKVISNPNDETPDDDIEDVKLLARTGNDFMEVENSIEHFLPVEGGINVTSTLTDEIHASETEIGEFVSAMDNPTDDIHTKKTGNVELVPCADDLRMEIENLIDDEHPVRENEQNDKSPSNDRLHISHSEEHDAVVEKASTQQDEEKCSNEPNDQVEGISPVLAMESNEAHIDQSENVGEYSKSIDELIKSESSGPSEGTSTSSKPDFSKLKGKICLDSLSVKELQETFRATFGRETVVKDKQWLQRRISMALSNSCHILSMNFVIDENDKVAVVQEENAKAICDNTLDKDLVVIEANENIHNQSEDPENVFRERLENPSAGHDSCSEDQINIGIGGKRARKPTKRYIEELSEVESRENNGNSISVSKNFGHGHSVSKPRVDTRSVRKPLVTRRDSLGGSGIRVPFVCRVQRRRPRENYTALMNFQLDCMDLTTKPKNEALDSHGPLDGCRENKVYSAASDSAWVRKHSVDEPEKERPSQERETSQPEKDEENVEPTQGDSHVENSDSDIPNVEISKGGVKRKHHRPWSLTEVVNLVEGVARFGVGRWSEIKKLSFASYSYRTSVDLKDKWRNLLRASFAQPAAEQANPRKQVSGQIPPHILVRVRELSKMHAQVPPILKSNKLNCENVHATSPGYL